MSTDGKRDLVPNRSYPGVLRWWCIWSNVVHILLWNFTIFLQVLGLLTLAGIQDTFYR